MRTIVDEHLEFLNTCTASELDPLIDAILGKDRKGRISSELDISDDYKRYKPDHSRYTGEIVREIQKFGGNTFANMLRGGKGVPYKEILCDVCSSLKVKCDSQESVVAIEGALLTKMLEKVWGQMSSNERESILKDIGCTDFNSGGATSATLIAIFNAGGFKSYQLTVILANAIWNALFAKICGGGLSLSANAALTHAMKVLTGPIGWILSSAWMMIDAASPAKRVTIPSCIYIACLRKMRSFKPSLEDSGQSPINQSILKCPKCGRDMTFACVVLEKQLSNKICAISALRHLLEAVPMRDISEMLDRAKEAPTLLYAGNADVAMKLFNDLKLNYKDAISINCGCVNLG